MSSDLYELTAPDGRRFEIRMELSAPAAKDSAAVFAGDRQRAELLGYVTQRFEARDAKGASLGVYKSTADAAFAVAKLLQWNTCNGH